ncbi:hypothetical protein ACP70R_009487 [Stipagrostis hirtigluma subsp. patula]
MEPTVHDVLAFHRVDRCAYERLLTLGAGVQPARDAVALLMWLYRSATVDAVSSVRALVRTPAAAAQLVSEARAVLDGGAARAETTTTPLISCLCGGRAATVRRLVASCGPADNALRRAVAEEVLDGVGAIVFDDRLYALMRRHEEEGGGGGALPAELAAPYRRGSASAVPVPENEDGLSLFITFSKGFPLTREEINEFFTERWGDCVERVMMEKTPPGEAPTYGRVVFRRAAAAAAVLGGQTLAKLVVNGRHLWARKYVPRPGRRYSTS